MLRGKTILLGVSGSIAAYKIALLASSLVKSGADVHVLMTKNAQNFIHPTTFETLTGNKCLIDTFDRMFEFDVEHVSLAKKADLFLVAPASADIIARLSKGMADDMLTTTFLACDCIKLVSPAMNTRMYENPIVKDNLRSLTHYGIQIIQPESGRLACGDIGSGKMPEPETLKEYIIRALYPKDLKEKHVLVTAGPTREAIDPVRFISNYSTGKMGYAIAKAASMRGADVLLISGPCALEKPMDVRLLRVETAREMFECVKAHSMESDIIIKAAAVADYRPKQTAQEKIKKSGEGLSIELERTDDILTWLGEYRRHGQYICGFSMETENVLENSRQKLEKKRIDMIVANSIKQEGAGFAGDTNIVTMITRDEEIALELMTKEEVAHRLLSEIKNRVSYII